MRMKQTIHDSWHSEGSCIVNRSYGVLYVEISARLNRDYEKPFLYLCRVMLKSHVNFTEELALLPPLDEEEARKQEEHLRATDPAVFFNI